MKNPVCVPGMDSNRIKPTFIQCYLLRIRAKKKIYYFANMIIFPLCNMSMQVVIHDQGTGSYPCPPQGWQRKIRLRANIEPLNGPYFLIACNAYSEQVGVNLQVGGFIGEMQ